MKAFYLFIGVIGVFGLLGTSPITFAQRHYFFHKATAPSLLRTTVHGAALATELNKIVSQSNVPAMAVYVKSMKNKNDLFAYHIAQPLIPASTLKILTAEAALLFLGPSYQFSTQLLTDAKSFKKGSLQGNLYVVLSGDPTLTYQDLVELVYALKILQVQAVTGNVYIDNTAYDQRFYGPGWKWNDKNYCYAAPISASIINHNCLPFTVAPASVPGRAAQVLTSSRYFYPPIKNAVMTKARHFRHCSIHLSGLSQSMITIDGCMVKGHYAHGLSYVVTDVPEYNRALFKNLLQRLGIKVYGRVTFGSAPAKLALVSQHRSRPLHELINHMLKKSDNVVAGALFKKLGQMYHHRPGTWENGSLAVAQILSKKAGVNVTGMRVLDGSGLSPNNLVTPRQMMQVLDFAYHHASSTAFLSALPIAGVDGTLKHRLGHLVRRVRAKTGTISGVTSLAGYVYGLENEPLAFVIMINGRTGMGWHYRSIEDKIVALLARYAR